MTTLARTTVRARSGLLSRHEIQTLLLPMATLAVVLAPIFWINPNTMSYFGLGLLLNLAVPMILASMAQLCIIAVNDLDLSIGAFISLVSCIAVTWLPERPLLGVAALVACVLLYAAIGALVELFDLPSIVVTLGLSFVWGGWALILLPMPGGATPQWIQDVMNLAIPVVPTPIVYAVVIALCGHWFLMRSSLGVRLRGAGGNPKAIVRSGGSVVRAKALMYGLAGVLGILSALTLVGITTSADANIAQRYTLISIAAVILGGGSFIGGKVSPIGATLGAITLGIAASFLSFLNIAPKWQIGLQGAILIIVLSMRILLSARGERQ
ncbi:MULTISPECIES: ABC transporter permease [Herbaspirillum]|jgi:ribose transport system permease protein|uniref:ABC transporter permease n=1 Tax=Herbaspirillum aquaticum TaxID=568783 RepID=A0A225SX40_9BURK|nr:ABC transporter permease [Herbaspirillum sp. RU 5E]MRT27274.1 ABC transporter permease [Herbaspirillum sp. CAH-3]OWY35781.1 ABC transporter permease [Herbaspirillum aquaticum]